MCKLLLMDYTIRKQEFTFFRKFKPRNYFKQSETNNNNRTLKSYC